MFIAVLFTITKIRKQPKCPSVDEWIKQLWDIYTMEFYSAIKKKKILPFTTVWNVLEKQKIELPYNPGTALLGIYLKKPETRIQKNTSTPMFIATLFIINCQDMEASQVPISR